MSQILKTAVKTLLEADPTFSALMVGGIYDGSDGEERIERTETPDAFDANGEMLACCIINGEETVPFGPHWHSARAFFSLVFYQNRGFSDIDAASRRAYALLHRDCLPYVVELRRVGHTPDLEDPALECPMIIDRYQGVVPNVNNI